MRTCRNCNAEGFSETAGFCTKCGSRLELAHFVAIDVETANADLSSICQVGVASFRDGVLYDSWKSLVNPEDYFDPFHVSIHGIDEDVVRTAPTWASVYAEVASLIRGNIVVCHTAFDRVALARACEKNTLAQCECQWLDSARVVRRAWPKFSGSGYRLANVAAELGIKYEPHDALEDARCAGEILLQAIDETGLTTGEWLRRVEQQINLPTAQPAIESKSPDELAERAKRPRQPAAALPISRHGNSDGAFYGEVLVFTGALSMPRREAADRAAAAGCEVTNNVSHRTALLVVGDEDIRKLAGHEKSTKHRKAEELIAGGQNIRILGESDFQRMLGY